jgi:hypothetical protein
MKTTDQHSIDNLLLREGGYPHLPESNSATINSKIPSEKLKHHPICDGRYPSLCAACNSDAQSEQARSSTDRNHEITKTPRGFAIVQFNDIYDVECSIQKSSLATDDAIWIGVDDACPKIMASQAKRFGVDTNEECGYVSFPIPCEVLLTTRMHLNRDAVARLLPILQRFVETGNLSEG